MKKVLTYFILLLFLAACAPQAATEQSIHVTPPVEDEQGLDSVENAVVEILAENLGLEISEISVQSNEEVEFGDACMDIAFPDVMCAQVVTPGRIIILEANGIEYEYHTSADGDFIQPATFALIWTREGGIAGFCDRLVVFLSGEIYGMNCRAQPKEMASNFTTLLSASEQKQFNSWFLKFGEVNLDVSDPVGVADGMSNSLVFYGNGSGRPGKTDEQALFEWANELLHRLYS